MKSIEGIILKKSPRREADIVVTLYTKEHGLMEILAKGARKSEAKLKSGLDIFNQVEIFYILARYLPIATDFKIKDDFKNIKGDLFRLKLAHFSAGVMLKIFEPGLAEPLVWQKLSDFFSDININNDQNLRVELTETTYEWCHDILVLNGLNPRSPDFEPIKESDLKKKTQDLFLHHFGLTIDI